MSAARWQTPAQQTARLARQRDGRPDLAVMTNAERLEAGLMDRGRAAAAERLAAVPQVRLADRVRGPVPDDDLWATAPAGGDCDAA